MSSEGSGHRRAFHISRDVIAGLFLCVFAAAAYFGVRELPLSDPSGIGPGLVPKFTTFAIAVLGVLITATGISGSERLDRFRLRGPLFVLGAIVLFASTIRPFGLVVAGPLTVLVAGMADRDSRPFELIVFAIVLSALCVGLFKYLLRLPIPLAPFLLGY